MTDDHDSTMADAPQLAMLDADAVSSDQPSLLPPADMPAAAPPPGSADDGGYRVLARKYRPTNFDDVIGQQALVRTLRNAIGSGRIAQAFMLTGVRGVGKTTTARIIAKALNCIGPDGQQGPTITPCGHCSHCREITEDRHVDVIEMDAASRTGVGDIRELIEGVRYRPISARYKIYILDEVHMLSQAAFNALLKTLEEPPPHVKFIFATTEIRKVPVTVLSRCQRFDLRRVPITLLAEHFRKVAAAEGLGIEEDALAMIARAADGSVRDGLSILDQAIALSDSSMVSAETVRDMLGLADRGRLFDLFDLLMQGDAAASIALARDLYDHGADPLVIIQDLLAITHRLTEFCLVPDFADSIELPELERSRGRVMAEKLSVPLLARSWQILLKGIAELQQAASPIQALEMILLRVIYAADLPLPADLIQQWRATRQAAPQATLQTDQQAPGATVQPSDSVKKKPEIPLNIPVPPVAAPAPPVPVRAPAPAPAPADEEPPPWVLEAGPDLADDSLVAAAPVVSAPPALEDFPALLRFLEARKEALLLSHLRRNIHLVSYAPGHLRLRLGTDAPADLPRQLAGRLRQLTGQHWQVEQSTEQGFATVADQLENARSTARSRAGLDPLVQAVQQHFPGAKVTMIHKREDPHDQLSFGAAGQGEAGTSEETEASDAAED